jgi:hypothetical protein
MTSCPKCSRPVSDQSNFCVYCYAPIVHIKTDSPPAKPIEITYTPLTDSSGAVIAGSSQISELMKRYKDGYLVARATNGFGRVIKAVGTIIGVLIALIGLMAQGEGARDATSRIIGLVTIVFGIFAGTLLYIIGVLVSAQGQILKASLDSAVNSSPFLTNEYKAEIMSLPEA